MKALQIAATGMLAQQTRVSVISNNIANVDTTAYNARRAEFADLLYQHEKRAGAVSSDAGTVLPTGVQVGLGVRTAAISMDNTRGSLRQTDGDLDLADRRARLLRGRPAGRHRGIHPWTVPSSARPRGRSSRPMAMRSSRSW